MKPQELLQAQQQKKAEEDQRLRRLSEEQGKKIAKVEHLDPKGQTKRWFKTADVDQFHSKESASTMHRVLLDDRIVLTPQGRPLWTPSEALSYAVAAEWNMQKETITPHMMPLMGLCCTALDSVPVKRDHAISNILSFILTDTICYRAKTSARRLYDEQVKYHQPILDWAQERFNCPLTVVSEGSFEEAVQPDILFQKVRWHLNEMTDWEIAGMYQMTENTKSYFLSLALFEDKIDSEWALKASRTEESFQISQFGLVEGEHDVTEADILTRLSAAVFFSRLVKGVPI